MHYFKGTESLLNQTGKTEKRRAKRIEISKKWGSNIQVIWRAECGKITKNIHSFPREFFSTAFESKWSRQNLTFNLCSDPQFQRSGRRTTPWPADVSVDTLCIYLIKYLRLPWQHRLHADKNELMIILLQTFCLCSVWAESMELLFIWESHRQGWQIGKWHEWRISIVGKQHHSAAVAPSAYKTPPVAFVRISVQWFLLWKGGEWISTVNA